MLKEHYLIEDYSTVLDTVENLFNSTMKAVNMAENAEFSTKNDVLAEMNHALETLKSLNKKKIDRDIDGQAWAYISRQTYV
ncbi:hypothetical protein M3E13_15455 [Oceanobacillus kimchii]|uniref:hypothetical protein n=1 Tax=Oceanobacillus kimchii TaxID=746691 RepID=UPI0021A466ED|nr:hypothetical protein [Oceanobacillus kimchii]MCT1575661.1 hypothetical protein [Oceanobacillus kimchii]MCT2137292.1 hypothetical protein [Oceanobacillus kimchii]